MKLSEFSALHAVSTGDPNAEVVVRIDLGPDQTFAVRGVKHMPDPGWSDDPGPGWLVIETGAASLPDDPNGATRSET